MYIIRRTHIRRTCHVALTVMLLSIAENALALSCASPIADHVVNHRDSPANILIGVPVTSRYVDNTQSGEPKIVFEVGQFNPTWGAPVVHMGRPYFVLLDEINEGVFKIGLCTRPLRLDPHDVTLGDGCNLYRFRELLNIDQPKSQACEVRHRQLSNNRRRGRSPDYTDHERKAMQEEFRRAKWRD